MSPKMLSTPDDVKSTTTFINTVNKGPQHESQMDWDFPELEDLSLVEKSTFRTIWCFCLGSAAFLDFAGAAADRLKATTTSDSFVPVVDESGFMDFMFPDDDFFQNLFPQNERVDSFLFWLRGNSFTFSIAFSLMWFLDAFIEAKRRRWQAFQKRDKEKLLGNGDDEKWLEAPLTVYYRSVAVQLLLLPVGFYVFLYTCAFLFLEPSAFQIAEETRNEGEMEGESEGFSLHAGISLGLAVVKYILLTVGRRTGYHFKNHITSVVRKRIRDAILFALRHPLKFSRRVRLLLYVLRWLKYIAPLFGALNKLKGNCADLIKKYRQHRAAGEAQRVRTKLWGQLEPDELREYAARLIQKIYRAHQARRTLRALRLLQGKADHFAALRLQRQFRMFLGKARARIVRKRKEFADLRSKQKEQRHRMKEEERRKMYRLQEELNLETSKLLNKRLLLRPNTRFAVVWKILFVAAVIFDIGQLALKPVLVRHIDSETGEPLNISRILEQKLVPVPILEQDVCRVRPKRGLRRLLGKLKRRSGAPKADSKSENWLCQEKYVQIQGVYRWTVRSLVHGFMTTIGLICFLDVFITFFTGEFDKTTGILAPKPFFERWILPGLVLQLLVNPNVEGVSNMVSHALVGALRRGPVRVFRWTVSFFYPSFLLIAHIVSHFWQQIVTGQMPY